MQRQRLTVSVTWDLVRWHLRGMYGKIEEGRDTEGTPTMRVMSAVDIKAAGKFELAIEWVGSVTNDMVADSVIALVLGVDGSPASVKSELGPRLGCTGVLGCADQCLLNLVPRLCRELLWSRLPLLPSASSRRTFASSRRLAERKR